MVGMPYRIKGLSEALDLLQLNLSLYSIQLRIVQLAILKGWKIWVLSAIAAC